MTLDLAKCLHNYYFNNRRIALLTITMYIAIYVHASMFKLAQLSTVTVVKAANLK